MFYDPLLSLFSITHHIGGGGAFMKPDIYVFYDPLLSLFSITHHIGGGGAFIVILHSAVWTRVKLQLWHCSTCRLLLTPLTMID